MAHELLADDGCRPVEVEPETVRANGNGHHDDEADQPNRTLFSWAEFMAEGLVKPKGRSRKPKPASMSLFEWAFSLEQEPEAEPVGAAR